MSDDIGGLILTLHRGDSFKLKVPGEDEVLFEVDQVSTLWADLLYRTDGESRSTRLTIDLPWEYGKEEVYLTVTFLRQDGLRAKLRLEAPREYGIERI